MRLKLLRECVKDVVKKIAKEKKRKSTPQNFVDFRLVTYNYVVFVAVIFGIG
jgi:hypothetical protein